MNVICPKCGYPQYCGCPSCRESVPVGFVPQIVREDIDGYECPDCGFLASCDGWLMIEEAILRGNSIIVDNNDHIRIE